MTTNHNNHPRSLKVFFATEMWERYGFYVVQTLLALYLVMHFGWDDSKVYPLIGAFTALTYLSPVVGGFIADRLLGQKRSILAGSVILLLSYVSMSYWVSELGLLHSLAGVAVGTGLLKPNISSLLGNEYPPGSAMRERGFTIFYMGITTGIIVGTTLPSYIQSNYSWPQAFLSAAIGMVFAILIFSCGIRYYQIADYNPYQHRIKNLLYAAIILCMLFFGSFYILHNSTLADFLFGLITLVSFGYVLFAVTIEKGQQAKQTLVIGLLCVISIMFWAFYFQMFSSIMVFLKRLTSPSLFGIPFPPPYYVAVQSFGMVVLGFFLGRNSTQTKISQRTIQTGNKFVLAMVFMTLAYLLLTLVCKFDSGVALLTPLYFIPSYLMISLAELLLSPVGLSAVTLLSSQKKVSTMMGIFFVSLGIGGYISGKLATLAAIPKEQLDVSTVPEIKALYTESFTKMLFILIAATAISIGLNFVIRCLMKPRIEK